MVIYRPSAIPHVLEIIMMIINNTKFINFYNTKDIQLHFEVDVQFHILEYESISMKTIKQKAC